MAQTVLITGGAGFIGRHLARRLLLRGDHVRILDSFVEQAHPQAPRRGREPGDLPADAQLIRADLRDKSAVLSALRGADKVVNLAAEVGVGQSMYAIERYVSANDLGTAILMEAVAEHPVQRIVVASSMSIYGEGLYQRADGALVEDAHRAAPRPGRWSPVDEEGVALTPLPTPESKRPALSSVYALSKYVQERLTLTIAQAYGVEGVALRLFNVYGPGQALSNPYTGVLAIFASRLLHGRSPLLFEDGLQRRDFVHVEDVAEAFMAALDHPGAVGRAFNIGSGRDRTIEDIALLLARAMGRPDLAPEITNKSRAGDIRHCFADISEARAGLGFVAQRDLAAHLDELAEWVARQTSVDRVAEAGRELEQRGLVA